MPYQSGETPMMGDHVRHRSGSLGVVKHVDLHPGNMPPGNEQVSVEWDDGGVGLSASLAAEYTLVSRAEESS